MVGWIGKSRPSPIGVDIGSRSVKLLQFDAHRSAVREAARWDLAAEGTHPDRHDEQILGAIGRAREGRVGPTQHRRRPGAPCPRKYAGEPKTEPQHRHRSQSGATRPEPTTQAQKAHKDQA